jgi:uncharacterized damage-inducible protein DinB
MIEAFRHNSWATMRLIDFCRTLDPSLLDAAVRGTYGTVKDTLAHVVGTDEWLSGMVEAAGTAGSLPAFTSLDDLMERARWTAERWERVLQPEPHSERLVEREDADGGRRLVRVSTVLAQAVHHGNHHRAEVCTTLSAMEMEPPRIDAWAYSAWLAEWAERRRRDEPL